MKKNIFALLFLTVAFSSCMRLKVVQQYDKEVDFSQFKTFNLIGWMGDTNDNFEVDTKKWDKAFIAELEKRGMTKVDTGADISLAMFIVFDRQSTSNRYNVYYGASPYGYSAPGWGWGTGYGYGYNPSYPSSAVPYKENAFLQGTLVVDAFSNKSKKLVWQGVASKAMNPDERPNRDAIPGAAKKLFAKFPVKVAK